MALSARRPQLDEIPQNAKGGRHRCQPPVSPDCGHRSRRTLWPGFGGRRRPFAGKGRRALRRSSRTGQARAEPEGRAHRCPGRGAPLCAASAPRAGARKALLDAVPASFEASAFRLRGAAAARPFASCRRPSAFRSPARSGFAALAITVSCHPSACAVVQPGGRCIPASFARRFPEGTSIAFDPCKLLILLWFPATGPPSYKHDAVTDRESRKARKTRPGLWIT
jgi:hypothetical protein